MTRHEALQLTEGKFSFPVLLTPLERVGLETHFEASFATEPDGRVRVRSGNVVGSLNIEGRDVLVQPKLPVDRVLFMTAYAADPYHWDDRWSIIGRHRSLTDGIAALFVNAYRRTLAQGLLRSYRTITSDENTIRGRIRWDRQARRPAPLPISVRYQVHDDDILENQILRTTVQLLRRQRLASPGLKGDVARIWQQLRDLTPRSVTSQTVDQLTWTRQNAHYRPLLELARTILAGSMPDLRLGTSTVPVTGFTLRLSDVFEKFVRTALREALGATAAEFPDNPSDHQLVLDDAHRVPLKPDLGLRSKEGWLFIGDVKYKADSGSGHNADLYQLLAYATAAQLPEATLIYAEGPSSARSHHVRHTEVTLQIEHLSLDQQPSDVLRELAKIARSAAPRWFALKAQGQKAV